MSGRNFFRRLFFGSKASLAEPQLEEDREEKDTPLSPPPKSVKKRSSLLFHKSRSSTFASPPRSHEQELSADAVDSKPATRPAPEPSDVPARPLTPPDSSNARLRAVRMYDMTDTSMAIEEYAAFLGAEEEFNVRVRHEYLDLFDFTDTPLLIALRRFCSKLFIRGETQVLDRVLEGFARRWHACNPDEPLTSDEAYVVVFALIALNTDLHTARLEQDRQMKRQQFVQNTISAIADADRKESSTETSSTVDVESKGPFPTGQSIRVVPRSTSVHTLPAADRIDAVEVEIERAKSERRLFLENRAASRNSGLVAGTPAAAWQKEFDLKMLLQEMYNSIKRQRILQPQGNQAAPLLFRSNSVRSTSTEKHSRSSSALNLASTASSFTSPSASGPMLQKSGSRGSLLLAPQTARPYQPEYDDMPSPNFRGLTSAGEALPGARRAMRGVNPVGFANSLNKQSIREEGGVVEAETGQKDDPEADKLALTGPPFAKEGILSFRVAPLGGESSKKKQQSYQPLATPMLETSSARLARNDCFGVCSSGILRVFDFHAALSVPVASHSSSKRSGRSRGKTIGEGNGGLDTIKVGGGNWMDSARPVLEICLVHAVARAVRPGSARSASSGRTAFSHATSSSAQGDNQWSIETSDGRVCSFFVGTHELVEEWVETVNHWAARTSKEPLLGAVGSAEFGWGWTKDVWEDEEQRRLLQVSNDRAEAPTLSSDMSQLFTEASVDGDRSQSAAPVVAAAGDRKFSVKFESTSRPRPGDRVHSGGGGGGNGGISEWSMHMVPSLPSHPSELPLEDQLNRLRAFWFKLSGELDDIDRYRPFLSQCWTALADSVSIGATPTEAQLARMPQDQRLAYHRAVGNFERRRKHIVAWLDRFGRYVMALECGVERRKEILNLA